LTDVSEVGTKNATWAVPRDSVVLTLPAVSAYLSVLRTATAGLAARLDFTLDEIEDLRIAVDEACAMLLSGSRPDSELRCRFELEGNQIDVAVTIASKDGKLPARDTFAWTVLTALAGEVDSDRDEENNVTIRLVKRKGGTA
jgi:serine/threonine-protein kinase RsbW